MPKKINNIIGKKGLMMKRLSCFILALLMQSIVLASESNTKKEDLLTALKVKIEDGQQTPQDIKNIIYSFMHKTNYSNVEHYGMIDGLAERLSYPTTINNLIPVPLVYSNRGFSNVKKAEPNSETNNFQMQIHYKSNFYRVDDDIDGSSNKVSCKNITSLSYDGPNAQGKVAVVVSTSDGISLESLYMYLPGAPKKCRKLTKKAQKITTVQNIKKATLALNYYGSHIALNTQNNDDQSFLSIYDYKTNTCINSIATESFISKMVWFSIPERAQQYAAALIHNQMYFVSFNESWKPSFHKQTFKDKDQNILTNITDIAANPLCPQLLSFLVQQDNILSLYSLNLANPFYTFKKVHEIIAKRKTEYSIWNYANRLGVLEVGRGKRKLTLIAQENLLLSLMPAEPQLEYVKELDVSPGN